MNQPWVYMCPPSWTPLPPPSPSHPSGSFQCTSPEHLSHASNLDWRSISHMVIYMFQWYSLRSSHPHLLPQSPKVCSLHLCLFCCLAYRVIITIVLNSMYMRSCPVLVFFFLTYFHSSILAWGVPWMEELGEPQSMELQRVRHDLGTGPRPTQIVYLEGDLRKHKWGSGEVRQGREVS